MLLLVQLTSLAQDPPMRKFPGMVGGLNARQLMLSSGGEVTSTSCCTSHTYNTHNKEEIFAKITFTITRMLLTIIEKPN